MSVLISLCGAFVEHKKNDTLCGGLMNKRTKNSFLDLFCNNRTLISFLLLSLAVLFEYSLVFWNI
jgi:hypothetical protein